MMEEAGIDENTFSYFNNQIRYIQIDGIEAALLEDSEYEIAVLYLIRDDVPYLFAFSSMTQEMHSIVLNIIASVRVQDDIYGETINVDIGHQIDFFFVNQFPWNTDSLEDAKKWLANNGYLYNENETAWKGSQNTKWHFDMGMSDKGIFVAWFNDIGPAEQIYDECKKELIAVYGEPIIEISENTQESYFDGGDIGIGLVLRNRQVQIGIGTYEYMSYWMY